MMYFNITSKNKITISEKNILQIFFCKNIFIIIKKQFLVFEVSFSTSFFCVNSLVIFVLI